MVIVAVIKAVIQWSFTVFLATRWSVKVSSSKAKLVELLLSNLHLLPHISQVAEVTAPGEKPPQWLFPARPGGL